MKARLRFVAFSSLAALLAAPASPAAAFDAGDLEGTWYGVSLAVVDDENDPYLFEYAFEIDAEGDVSGTVTSYLDIGPEIVVDVSSGHFDITPTGGTGPVLIGAQQDQVSFSVTALQMNTATDFMAGSGTGAPGEVQINLFAKVGDSYDIADLGGVWKIAGFAEHIGVTHAAEKITGVLELNTAGAIVDVSWIQFGGGSAESLTPGTRDFQIDANGAFHTEPDLGGDFSMQLAAGKTLAVGRAVGWEANGRSKQQVYVLVKTLFGAVSADMAGDWYVNTFFDEAVANAPGYEHGNIKVDAAGTEITEGLLHGSNGAGGSVTGGSVATDDQGGVVLGDITYLDSEVVTTGHVDLEAGRQVFAGHTSDTEGRISLIVGIPEPGTALLALASLGVLAALRRPDAHRAGSCRGRRKRDLVESISTRCASVAEPGGAERFS